MMTNRHHDDEKVAVDAQSPSKGRQRTECDIASTAPLVPRLLHRTMCIETGECWIVSISPEH